VLTDLENRGVRDVFFLVCDGLKGLPDAVGSVWPLAIVQTCIIHLIRNTFNVVNPLQPLGLRQRCEVGADGSPSAGTPTRLSGISGLSTPRPARMPLPRHWANWKRNGVIHIRR
jgi:Transposase, Mutator family